MALAAPAIAASRSPASLKMMFGDLPPSSRLTFFRFPAAARTMIFPTSVEPVKATLSTSRMRGESGARRFTKAGDNVHDAFGNAGLENQFAEPQGG